MFKIFKEKLIESQGKSTRGILFPMESTSRQVTIGVAVLILIILAGGWYLGHRATVPAPTTVVPATSATSTPAATSTTPAPVATTPVATSPAAISTNTNPIPVDRSDVIASWTIAGAPYAVGSKNAEIAAGTARIKAGDPDTYDDYIGNAEDYELMGDGQDAYANYVLAAETNVSKGLAFDDIGELMTKLGAFATAREAYAKAVMAEPTVQLYELSYLQFLTAHAPNDPATALAFKNARASLGATPDLLINEAEWYAVIGNTTAAIADWEAVRPYVSLSQQTSIDATVAKLKAGQ